MAKDLIIVESPAKVKTIKKFLGNNYIVQASVGHVRDLPTKSIGVDEENNFTPAYEIINGKQKIVSALREAAAKADNVFLAPDPDREGEAIACHVAEIISKENQNIQRIQFNEITARAVREALEHPRPLNRNLFDAQQARRVLDRLVGYKISPLLWNKVKRGISAGRVQSVALRLIVDREKERHEFRSEEYWTFQSLLQSGKAAPFKTELVKVNSKKLAINNADDAQALEDRILGKNGTQPPFIVESVEEKERSRAAQPPFITSTLQQIASQRLGFSAKRTMGIAQKLYEGVELGDLGLQALITYMRTDSVRIADEAQKAAHEFISQEFGEEFCPKKANKYKTKDSAQDAHEAIRPVDITITPERIKGLVPPEQFNLYRLIWSRFLASQMAPARFHDTTVTIICDDTQWRVKGERILFAGFMCVAPTNQQTAPELPPLEAGQKLLLCEFSKEQKFTQPPARYTEASLVRELEEKGIGRPSTYASIISTLIDREYAKLEDKAFVPSDLGNTVCMLLEAHFTELMDISFTAQMENSLDKVAEGDLNWVKLMTDFTQNFNPALAAATKEMKSVKGGVETGITCPQCGKPMVIKFGKAGDFLACSGYPDCKNTSNFTRDENGNITLVEREQEELKPVGKCPECGSDLVVKRARTGSRFIACTGYPNCRHAEPFSTGVPCPKEGCGGMLVEKSSHRGKIFYACNNYPQCDYALWDMPVAKPCPECNSPLMTIKTTKARGKHLLCPNPECKHKEDLPDED